MMNLNEQEQQDLAGLASELSGPESAVRALHLLETSPEAVEFFRQMASLHQVLQQEAEKSPPPLSTEEADALEAAILAKARRSPKRFGLTHPWRWGVGLAAMIALMVLAWPSHTPDSRLVIAEATFVPVPMQLSAGRTPPLRRAPISAGEPIETERELTVLKLPDGGLIVVGLDARFVPHGARGPMELRQGEIYIQAAGPMQVQAGDAMIHLEKANTCALIRIFPLHPECRVWAGQARITHLEAEILLSSGQVAVWDQGIAAKRILDPLLELPSWVPRALRLAIGPEAAGIDLTIPQGGNEK